jgi:hypothetical protein
MPAKRKKKTYVLCKQKYHSYFTYRDKTLPMLQSVETDFLVHTQQNMEAKCILLSCIEYTTYCSLDITLEITEIQHFFCLHMNEDGKRVIGYMNRGGSIGGGLDFEKYCF